jgi:hypothetical protein
VAGDPGELGLLAVGEVLGVLPQRVAAALQCLAWPARPILAQQVPDPAAHHVEGLGRPPHDVERVEAQRRVLQLVVAHSPIHSAASALTQLDLGWPVRGRGDRRSTARWPGRGRPWPTPAGRCRDRPRPSDTCGRADTRSHRSRSASSPSKGSRAAWPSARPAGDRADGAPRDPHQLDHRGLGGVRHQPRDLIIERSGVAGIVTSPRHRRDRHPMVRRTHPGRQRR